MNSGLKKVRVVGSIGTSVIFFHDSCSTIEAASGSQRMLNSRRGELAYSAAKPLSAATGLKLPPMKTSSSASEANSGSNREAMARLVRGPAATIVTRPGNSCTLRARKLAALSWAGLIFGAPAGEGGPRYGSAGSGGRRTAPRAGQPSVHAPL